MLKIKSRLLLLIITLFISALISFVSLLLLFGIDNLDFIDFTKVFLLTFLVVYILGNVYTRSFLYSKLKEISKDILPEKNISQTVTTNMEELASEIKDYDSKRKSEFSEMKKLESFRREFIGNLAHEIKTPLFTSQSYILTLLDGAIKDENVNMQYLNRSSKSVDRMINIVEDLEMISKIESNQLELEFTRWNVIDHISEIFDVLEMKAKKRSVTLSVDNQSTNNFVKADRDKISQVLINLIENSIKYGNEGGHTKVRIFDMGENLLIEIADNGAGITAEHLPRLFERFYRVDKSRSRSEGGTGLGLSIVKHIIEAHRQTINVRSTENVGTTFSFTLKNA